jgi:hypothetical protein
VAFASQFSELFQVEQRRETGNGLADEQGLFMPVVAQEFCSGDIAEEWKFFHAPL